MEYKIKKLPKSEVELEVTVSKEELKKHEKRACEDISKEVKIDGFRAGHIPQEILKKHVGEKYIIAKMQELAIQVSYAETVIKEKLNVISRPKIHIEKDDPLTFKAVVAVMPEIEVKDYKSIKIKPQKAEVTQKDIEEAIKDLEKYATTYKEVEREAKKGDRVEVDFEGFDEEGKADESTKSKNHPVVIGENSLIPGFEDELLGLKKGEKKEFDITFPKDYHKESYRNKKLKFKVEVKMVEEPNIPELNEEFIKKMTGKKMLVEEFKKELEKNIKTRKEQEAQKHRENEYLEELLKRTKIELPESLIYEEVHYIIEDIKDDMGKKGIEFKKFLEQAKIDEDKLHEKYRPEAEKRLKIRLVLQYVIKEEKITVSEEKLKAELERVKSFYPPKEHTRIEDDYKKGHLKAQIENRLILKELFGRVLA